MTTSPTSATDEERDDDDNDDDDGDGGGGGGGSALVRALDHSSHVETHGHFNDINVNCMYATRTARSLKAKFHYAIAAAKLVRSWSQTASNQLA